MFILQSIYILKNINFFLCINNFRMFLYYINVKNKFYKNKKKTLFLYIFLS